MVSACASTPDIKKIKCMGNEIEQNGKPCWVNTDPGVGVVVNMPKHIRPEKTREILFNTALTELSVMQGASVLQEAVVSKKVEVHNASVSKNASVTSFSVITTPKDSTTIKAKIKAVWNDYATQKLYMWVVLEE